ncbi:HNH endonuclease [Serratia ficaria]|uniref:HNH endonuclease n=1 Tax=Serratia ficaria TaxID=61651 RepID=UPI0009FBA4DB|nr:HNH endonuclease [Serratia ficaria]
MRPVDISKHLSWDELTKTLSYDPDTGMFKKKALTKHQKERVAGTDSGSPYTRICINRKLYLAHRLAWYYMTGSPPEVLIDHINGDKRDNRFCNLRPADYSQNMMNSKIASSNTSGCKGVSWKKSENKWMATGKINGKRKHLGYFDDIKEAVSAYKKFALQHHAQFYLDTSLVK